MIGNSVDGAVDRSDALVSELLPACTDVLDTHTVCGVRCVQEASEVQCVQGRGDKIDQDEHFYPESCMHILSQQCPEDVACDADQCMLSP